MIRMRTVAVMVIVALVAAACGSPPDSGDDEIDIDEPQRPSLPSASSSDDAPIQIDEPGEADATAETAAAETRMSDVYDGLELILNDVRAQANDEGTIMGELELTITLRNTGDSVLELPFTMEDYTLETDAGLSYDPAEISDALIAPVINAGDEVTGTIDYTTEDSISTYVFEPSTFGEIIVDATAEAEDIDAVD